MEGDNPSGKLPVQQLPEALQRTLESVPDRFMGGYNTWYVRVMEDDWNRIVAHIAACDPDTVRALVAVTRAAQAINHDGPSEDNIYDLMAAVAALPGAAGTTEGG